MVIDEVKPSSSNQNSVRPTLAFTSRRQRQRFSYKGIHLSNPNLYHIDFVSQDIADMIGRG